LHTGPRTNKHRLDLYRLSTILHEEAQYVEVQAVLVNEKRPRRIQKKAYRDLQGKLHDYWQQKFTTTERLHCYPFSERENSEPKAGQEHKV